MNMGFLGATDFEISRRRISAMEDCPFKAEGNGWMGTSIASKAEGWSFEEEGNSHMRANIAVIGCVGNTTNGRGVPGTVICHGVEAEMDFVVAVRVTERPRGFAFELFEQAVVMGSARVVAETFALSFRASCGHPQPVLKLNIQ
jgi:hypothetical protein